jgi:hypothetical protein
MRQDDEMFATWRTTIRESLQAVESYDASIGSTDESLTQKLLVEGSAP